MLVNYGIYYLNLSLIASLTTYLKCIKAHLWNLSISFLCALYCYKGSLAFVYTYIPFLSLLCPCTPEVSISGVPYFFCLASSLWDFSIKTEIKAWRQQLEPSSRASSNLLTEMINRLFPWCSYYSCVVSQCSHSVASEADKLVCRLRTSRVNKRRRVKRYEV